MSKQLISNPTIGADVEVFFREKNGYGIVTAEGKIKGTKHDPFYFREGNPFFSTSLDNVMAEFSIPPAKVASEFVSNIDEALTYIQESIPDYNIIAEPSVFLPHHQLQSESARTFGCEPDYNAWKFGEMNPRPASSTNMRSAGGHIHIGYEEPDEMVSQSLIRAMDIFVGLPAVIQEPPNERKRLYGKAGAYRIKPYGVEYRTPSNYYINKTNLMEQVFENTLEAIKFVNAGVNLSMDEGEGVQTAINTGNKELAEALVEYFGVKYSKERIAFITPWKK